jgi:hypothetical protein
MGDWESDMPTKLENLRAGDECGICQKRREDAFQMDRHHTNYERDEWVTLCHECHMDVHQEEGFYDELAPAGTKQW